MANKTGIQWTDRSSNPIRAVRKSDGRKGWHCTKVSQGCAHCYAERMNQWRGTGLPFSHTSSDQVDIVFDRDELASWARIRKPQRIFVCDMTDLLGEHVPTDLILEVFAAMEAAPQHTFQVLTKRPERFVDVLGGTSGAGLGAPALPNVWLGVSVEDQAAADLRIPLLLQTPAAVRFLSCEPLLEALDLVRAVNQLDWLDPANWQAGGINWVIVGGESGTAARPFVLDWGRGILEQCRRAEVPCFIKQLGARPCVISQAQKTQGAKVVLQLKDSHGGDMDEWPLDLRVREFPKVAA